MATTEERKIKIIADGKSVDASFTQMSASLKILNNQMKKLPQNSDAFTKKNAEYEEMKKRVEGVKKEMYGTNQAQTQITKGSGLMRQGFNLAVKALLPLFAFAKFQELITHLFSLEGQWTKLKGTIQQTTDLQGEALDEAAIRTTAIANTFDKDNQVIFSKAKTLVNSFKISYEEAFKIIEDGLLAAGNQGDEYLEQIGEYSGQFADAGASAEEFGVISVNALNQGIFSD